MNLRTELQIPESPHKISLHTPVLTIGSCFAEVMGSRLLENKIPALANPFGTIFNPIAMVKLIKQAIGQDAPDENLYIENQGLWFHYDFHSSLWASSKQDLKEVLLQKLEEVKDWLKKTDFLIFTFGTAFVYRHIASDQIVANCHKIPAKQFQKELLSINEIIESFALILPFLDKKPQIILTVSPVRHTRDTLPLNTVSKSILRVACHQLSESIPNVHYFPAYEILLDDLRDYRFYKSDLIHPNEVAEAYIFEQFSRTYFDLPLQKFIVEWQKIRQALAHRPLQSQSKTHQKFLGNLLQKLVQMPPFLDVETEIEWVKKQMAIE